MANDDIGELPTAEEFRLLNELDTFNKAVRSAVAYLKGCGHHARLIEWALAQHVQMLVEGGYMLPLVATVLVKVDEETNKEARPRLSSILVEAGAMANTDPATLRRRLSDARNDVAALKPSMLDPDLHAKVFLASQPEDVRRDKAVKFQDPEFQKQIGFTNEFETVKKMLEFLEPDPSKAECSIEQVQTLIGRSTAVVPLAEIASAVIPDASDAAADASGLTADG